MTFQLDTTSLPNADPVREPINSLCVALGLRGWVRLSKEFSDGFSPTRVFLAERRETPDDRQGQRFVFKTGAGRLLRDEVQRYQVFSATTRADAIFAKLLKPEGTAAALPHNDRPGAIAYHYAPDPLAGTECRSLRDVVRGCIAGDPPLEHSIAIVAKLVRALGSLYANPRAEFGFAIPRYYLTHWPPDFRSEADVIRTVGSDVLLTQYDLNPSRFQHHTNSDVTELRAAAEGRTAERPRYLVLPDGRMASLEGERLTLHVPHAEELAIEVDVGRVGHEERAPLSGAARLALWAPPGESRLEFYRRQLAGAMISDAAMESSSFTVGEFALQNPLRHLSAPLIERTRNVTTEVVPAHGDLHPGNVLVVDGIPVVIDYGKAESQLPIGVDVARLFGALARDVLADLELEDLVAVLQASVDFEAPFTGHTDPVLERAIRLWRSIPAEFARVAGDAFPRLWPLHLYGYSLIALKWPGSARQRCASLLLASVALTRLLGPAAAGEPLLARPKAGPEVSKPKGSFRRVAAEKDHEILVLVTRFAGHAGYDPTTRIHVALEDAVAEMDPPEGKLSDRVSTRLVRVERVDEVVASANQATELSQRYRASMVVWGTYDEFGVRPRYEVTRDSLIMKQAMLQLDEKTRHELKDRFEPYITHNLPADIGFLSLRAIGEMCLLNLNFQAAIRAFRKALELVPDRPRVAELGGAGLYRSLCAVHIAVRQYPQAREALNVARELDPGALLNELLSIGVHAKAKAGDSHAMVKDVKDRLEKFVTDPDVDQAERDALRGVLDHLAQVKSPKDIERLVTLTTPRSEVGRGPASGRNRYSKDVMSHIARAVECINRNVLGEALKAVNKALRINGGCVDALVLRAQIHAISDRVPQAWADLERAQRIDPSRGDIHLVKGEILLEKQELEGSLREVETAQRLGADVVLDSTWGRTLIALGRGDEVMAALAEREVDPTALLSFVLRTEYHLHAGRYSAALTQVDQGLELDPDSLILLEQKARVLMAAGAAPTAIHVTRNAIEKAGREGGFFTQRRLTERLAAFQARMQPAQGDTAAAPAAT